MKFYNPHVLNRGQSIHRNEACILYITDYTVNGQLMHYEEDSSVRVAGQRVLQVSIFGAQNDPLLAFHEDKLKGRLVSLRNIRPKLNGSDLLEATMVEDDKFPDKRDVKLLVDRDVDRVWYKELKACVLSLPFEESGSPLTSRIQPPRSLLEFAGRPERNARARLQRSAATTNNGCVSFLCLLARG